ASLPLITYRGLAAGGKERARDLPLYRVLRWQPNGWQTSLEYNEMLVGHLCTRGNFYAQILEGPRGLEQLVPRHPDRMQVELAPSGRKVFTWLQPNGDTKKFTQDEMHHVAGFSSDGITGVSVIRYGAQSLGSAAAADSFAARFFSQGGAPAFAAIHPKVLGEEGRKNLSDSINAYTTGLANAHGVLVLEEDMKVSQLGIKPQDAQLLATREHSTREVARWLGLPTIVLADNGQAPTQASAEEFGLQLVTYSFRPLATRIEMAIGRDLIVDPEQVYSEFLMDALMRGDSAARAQFYGLGIQWGWFTRAEAREKENLNPIDGLEKPLQPLNMTTDVASTTSPAPRQADRRTRATAIVEEAAARLVRKELLATAKGAERHAASPEGWKTFLREFYEKQAHDIARDLKMSLDVARDYAARHGLLLEQRGIGAAADWEWLAVAELTELALEEPVQG